MTARFGFPHQPTLSQNNITPQQLLVRTFASSASTGMGNLKKTVAARHSRQHSATPTKEALTTLSELVDADGAHGDMSEIQDDIEHGVAHPVSGMSELEEQVNDLDNSWETESLLADMLDGLADDTVHNGKSEPLRRASELRRPPPISPLLLDVVSYTRSPRREYYPYQMFLVDCLNCVLTESRSQLVHA